MKAMYVEKATGHQVARDDLPVEYRRDPHAVFDEDSPYRVEYRCEFCGARMTISNVNQREQAYCTNGHRFEYAFDGDPRWLRLH